MRDHFTKLKSNLELNKGLEDLVSTRHNAVRDYVQNNNGKVKDTKLIGSLQRKTRIQPKEGSELDIDIVVVMGEFVNWVPVGGISPEQAMNELHTTIYQSDRYSSKNPTQDAPTVSITYDDKMEVQFVPAYIDNIGYDQSGNYIGSKGRGYWVVKNGRWEVADYDHEADYISNMNAVSDGYLIPTIKMLKAIKREYFSELGSFPLEIIATKIIPQSVISRKNRNISVQYHDLLQDFFDQATPHLSTALKIPESKSPAILLKDSVDVSLLGSIFGKIANAIRIANNEPTQAEKIRMWRIIVGDSFPTVI